MSKADARQKRLAETLELKFNRPGCPRSGIKPARRKLKLRGSYLCKCGRRISANKRQCFACQQQPAPEAVAA